MTFEYDEKGKFFTDVISKEPVDVIVQTTNGLIYGTAHIRKDERLKDELNREGIFLALTNVRAYNAAGQVAHETDFIAVNKKQIVWAIPKEKKQDVGGEK